MRLTALAVCVSLATASGMAHGAGQEVTAFVVALLAAFPGVAVLSCLALDWGTVGELRERVRRLNTELHRANTEAGRTYVEAVNQGWEAARNQPADLYDQDTDRDVWAEVGGSEP